MGLFDIFTGDSAKKAAEQNKALLQQNQLTGTATLNNNLASGTSILNNNNAYGLATLAEGRDAGIGALNAGQAGAIGSLDQAGGYYAPLAAKYGNATSLGLDALGANGAAGNTRAVDAFQAGPGYQYRVDQALDQARRAAARDGSLNGGNTLAALSDRAGNLANQEYGSWVDRLNGYVAPELQATGGMASAAANKAGVYTGTGSNIANIGSTAAGNMAGLGTTTAGGLTNLGTHTADSIVGLGTNTTKGITDQNTQAANAEIAGSGNLWGLGLNLAKLGVGAASGGTSLLGGGGGGAGLGSLFMGGGSPSGFGR